MNSTSAARRVLAQSIHHLPPGSVAKQRTKPNHWIELTVGVRRLKTLPDLRQWRQNNQISVNT